MSRPLAPGELFAGDYRVISSLSRGGMGSVYVVEQISTSKRRALKLMNIKTSDEASRRFEQEARIGARIKSEHVVDVIAAGFEAGTNVPWLVMELLEGTDLDTLATGRGAMPAAEVATILKQVCHGLGAAHDIRVVHRDLKPENIFIAESRLADGNALVKLLDFGIAKVLSGDHTTTATVGTPLWMAPEQTESDGHISPATDVWALGLIAFYLLSGRSYWVSASNESASTAAILREILFTPLEPAIARARRLTRASLPPGFDEWFARCVHRNPSSRFQHARDAWHALAPILDVAASAAHVSVIVSEPAPPSAGGGHLMIAAEDTHLDPPRFPPSSVTNTESVLSLQPRASRRGQRRVLAALAATVVTVTASTAIYLSVSSSGSRGVRAPAIDAPSHPPELPAADSTPAFADPARVESARSAAPVLPAPTTSAKPIATTPRPQPRPAASVPKPPQGPSAVPPSPKPGTPPELL